MGPNPDIPIDNPGSFKFTNNQNWGAVYVYGFNAEGTVGEEFPGVPCTEDGTNDYGETVYLVNIPEGATSVVLSDGNGETPSQTVDISDFSVEGYYTKAGDTDEFGHFNVHAWGDVEPDDGPTFLFTNNAGWSTCLVYAFNENGSVGAEWPGNIQAETTTNGYGEQQFIIHVPAGATGIVLNNGSGDQTENITDFTVSGYYTNGSRNGYNNLMVLSW
jgi:hypothetical protein